MLKAVFFGAPQIQCNNDDLSGVLTGRSLALFIYLAMADQPQERNRLADLLWSNIGDQQARQNLRYVLYDLRKHLGDYLIVTRQTLAFNHQKAQWIDARVFTTYLANKQTVADPALLQGVIQLYQDEFLAGFYPQNAPGFEAWLLQQRQQFHNQAIHALLLLSEQCLEQGDYAAGLMATRRILQLEPWQEEAHRRQMRLLVYSGQRLEALAQYTTCRQVLQAEYGVEPEAATTQLLRAIEAGQLALPQAPHADRTARACQVNWDGIPQNTRFVGREAELNQLHQWATGGQRRVIGLFGLAGQGKSALGAELVAHLAESAATEAAAHSAFEVVIWSTLTTIPSLSHLLHEWLERLTLTEENRVTKPITPTHVQPPATTQEPWGMLEAHLRRLLAQLRQRRILLIVDAGEIVYGSSGPVDAYKPGWEALDELLRRLAENEHRSCLLLLSRITPASWDKLARRCSTVRTLTLSGLAVEAGSTLLRSGSRRADDGLWQVLAEQCAGHPQTLVALHELLGAFGSDLLPPSHLEETLLGGALFHALQTHFARLSTIEQTILLQFVLAPEPQTAASLWHRMPVSSALVTYLEALQTLQHHQLLLPSSPTGVLVLPPLVKHFGTQHLITTLAQEIAQSLVQISDKSAPLRLRRQVDAKQSRLHRPGADKAGALETTTQSPRPGAQSKTPAVGGLAEGVSALTIPSEFAPDDRDKRHPQRLSPQRPLVGQSPLAFHYLWRYSLTDAGDPAKRLVHLLAEHLAAHWGIDDARHAIQRLRRFFTVDPLLAGRVGQANLALLHQALQELEGIPGATPTATLPVAGESYLN